MRLIENIQAPWVGRAPEEEKMTREEWLDEFHDGRPFGWDDDDAEETSDETEH